MQKNRIFNIIWTCLIYGAILFAAIFVNIEYDNQFRNNSTNFEYIGWIVIESLCLLLILLLYVIAINLQNLSIEIWKEKLIYSIITINIYWLILIVLDAFKHGFIDFRIKKWNTIDYVLIAISICVYMVLAIICKMLIPMVPQLFISLSLEYIALFFIAYITQSFLKTLLTGFICGMFLLALPTTYFISFQQFIFDYLLDNMVVAFSAFITIKKSKKNQVLRWFSFFTIPYIGVFISRVIAGVIFYKSFAWPGFPIVLYSMIINGLNTFFDYIVMMIVGPIVLTRLWPLKAKYINKNHKLKINNQNFNE